MSQFGRYLVFLGSAICLIFMLVWLYIFFLPGAFLESGYAAWVAKQKLLAECDLGEAIISGDSRSEAAIDPRQLDIPTRNISFGAATPIEGYFFIRRAMSCKKRPREVILAYASSGFTGVSQFLWEDGARFGFISYSDLNDVSGTAARLGDKSVDNVKTRLGFEGKLRNLLYAIRFPPLYFNALVSGQVFGRYSTFQSSVISIRNMLGHVPYVRPNQTVPPGAFKPLPVQDAFFERTLALLRDAHVRAVYVNLPLSETYSKKADPTAIKNFQPYLLNLAKRFPNFHVVEPLSVVWPDSALLDGIHLKAANVAKYTAEFRMCQNASLISHATMIPCDFRWNDISSH